MAKKIWKPRLTFQCHPLLRLWNIVQVASLNRMPRDNANSDSAKQRKKQQAGIQKTRAQIQADYRLRQAANLTLESGTLESNTTTSSITLPRTRAALRQREYRKRKSANRELYVANSKPTEISALIYQYFCAVTSTQT